MKVMADDGDTRVLVIEDNDTNRTLMTYLLKAFGYGCIEANDGEMGVKMAKTERPHLIICDVHLPRLDGYGVIAQLKQDETTKSMPVVAVTALAMVGDRSRILASGFDGYVSKPISPETFVQEIEQFLPADLRSKQIRRAPAQPAVTPTKSAQPLTPRATILVVDDVPANIDFARSTLEPSGYNLVSARGVQEALGLIERIRPDLILCDLHMYPTDGYEFLELIKTSPVLKEVPVAIISSTTTDERERLDCLRRGAARFIGRPIEPQALLAEVSSMLGAS